MRYVVLDTGDDWQALEVAGRTGTKLAEFNSRQRAITLVMERLALGYRGVVAVDLTSGLVVFPGAALRDENGPTSGIRRVTAEDPMAAATGVPLPRKRGG